MRETVRFREVKREVRIVGIDDSPFTPRRPGKADVVGVVFRGGLWLDGAMKTQVEVDGFDATDRIAEMIKASSHYQQLRVIMLNGLTLAGFNVVNIRSLFESTGLPVIAFNKDRPNMPNVKRALKNLSEWERRWEAVQDAGELVRLEARGVEVYVQVAGISKGDAARAVEVSCTRSSVPEPLRVAHIVASAIAAPLSH